MNRAATERRDDIVELMLAGAASGPPGLADAVLALALFRRGLRSGATSTLRRALDGAADLLPAALTGEIEGFLARDPDGDANPLLARLVETLGSAVRQRRETLAGELQLWAAHLEWSSLEPALELLRASPASSADDAIEAAGRLGKADELIRAAKGRVVADLRRLIEACGGGIAETGVLVRSRGAVEAGDPAAIAESRVALLQARRLHESADLRARQIETRERLARLRDQARALVEEGELEIDAASRGTLGVMLQQVGDLLERDSPDATDGESAWRGEELEPWEEALGTVLRTERRPAEERRRGRLELVQQIREGLARQLASRADDGDGSALAREVEQLEQALQDRVISGGPPFQEALAAGLARLRELERDLARDAASAAEDLRRSSHNLSGFLEKAGGDLPVPRLVDARIRLEQVDGTIAGGEPAQIAALDRAMHEELDKLQQLAARLRRRLRNREEAERDVLLNQVRELTRVATGRAEKRLGRLAADIEDADADALERIEHRVRRESRSVATRLRLVAARLLAAAEKRLRRIGKRDAGAGAELREAARRVRAGLGESDLETLLRDSGELREVLHRVAPLQRPRLRLALAGACIVVLAAAGFGAQRLMNRPKSVTLELPSALERAVTILLVQDGRVVKRAEFGPQERQLELGGLTEGSYEVYVDGRFAGQVVEVPRGDPLPLVLPEGP